MELAGLFFLRNTFAELRLYLYDGDMEQSLANLTVDESLFEPVVRLLRDYCRHRRDTLALSDERFLREALRRVLGHWDSGRDFLQARQGEGTGSYRDSRQRP
jgi:hypothetical protein